MAGDAHLDALLRNVEVPPGLQRQLRSIPRRSKRPFASPVAWAAAASFLAFITGGSYLLRSPRIPIELARTPTPLFEENHEAFASQEPPSLTSEPTRVSESPPADQRPSPQQQASRSLRARQAAPPLDGEATRRQTPITLPLGEQAETLAKQPAQVLQRMAGFGDSIRKAIASQQQTQSALGSSDKFEMPPTLVSLESPVARGIPPQRVRGYDLLFQLKHGEHPFIQPAMHPLLETRTIPFSFRTTSYDLALARASAGRLPASEDIRIEDFLSAQHYSLPTAPTSGLALHVAGGPSPLGTPNRQLLQFNIQGARQQHRRRDPLRLIVLVDTTPVMKARAHDRLVARALKKISQQLTAEDRVTLVGFSDTPEVLSEEVSREELARLTPDDFHSTGASANIDLALLAAIKAIDSDPKQVTRQVLLISTPDAFRSDFARQLDHSLTVFSNTDTRLNLVALETSGGAGPKTQYSPWNSEHLHTLASADEVAKTCLASLANHPLEVAHGVSMQVKFRPDVVGGYRLLGHEASTLTGDANDPLIVDFHAGQTATCLFELWLTPETKTSIGTVEVRWSDPANGQPRQLVRPIRREDFAVTFAESRPWLQQGAIAARVAEYLRNSYYLPVSRRWAQLLELTKQVSPEAAQTPEFQELVRLVQQGERLK